MPELLQNLFPSLIELAHDAIIVRDASNIILHWNQGAVEMYGWSREEALGHAVHQLLQTQLSTSYPDPEAVLRAEGRWEGELTHTRRDRSQIIVESRQVLVRHEHGGPLAILEINRDVTKRKRAEAALRESDELHRITLSNISDAVFITDNAGAFTYVCPNVDIIFGYSHQEVRAFGNIANLLGDGFFDQSGSQSTALWEIPNIEREITDKAGRRHVLLVNIKRVSIKGGTILYTCRDITERKRAEQALQEAHDELEMRVEERTAELAKANAFLKDLICERERAEAALRESELRFRSLAESANDAIISADNDGNIGSWNKAAQNIFGYTSEEVLNRPLTLLMPERFRAAHQRGLERLRTTGESRLIGKTVELYGLRKDGREFPIELSLATWKTGEGTFYSGIISDITERRQAEAALRESEARFHRLADAMPQIVWMARPDGNLDYYNQRWYEFTGFANGEGGDESWKPILHPEDVQRCVDCWHKAVQSGEPFQIEYRFKDRQTGGYRWYLGRALPIRDETGRVVRWFGTCTDIDDRKRAEEAIAQLLAREQEARERAEAATRAKDEFVAMVSHDLRTPLTAILGWVRLLRAGQLDADDSVRALATIERSAKSQLQLTDDLLDLSRITAGKLSLNARPIELVPIIQAALDTVRLAAEAKGVQLESDLDPGSSSITGDSDRLQQVVWNLLSNAIKFTPRGGRITVRLKRAGTHAQITVSDTGIGIRADFLPYVFDRFRQADPSSPRAKGGLGLGLTIVRHLVELHGGTVRAESPGEGQGATFTVELPQRVVRAETVEEKSVPRTVGDPGPAPSLPTLDGVRVLIVDDEADAREFIAHVLDQCGARVLAVASVREALEALKLRRPDVLVSDIAMPGEDGYALMAQVKALEATYGEPIPAVALTAYAGPEDRERVLSAGYQRHIPKPVQPIKLATVIANLVGRIGQGPEAQSKS